jgi:hypothetical protein
MKSPERRMMPVLKESILSSESALCEKDSARTSVKTAEVRYAEKAYKTEGTHAGRRIKSEGVRNENESSSLEAFETDTRILS